MKKFTLALAIILLVGTTVFSQEQLSFKFTNVQIVTGTPDVLQFDIAIKADNAGTFHRDLQIYVDYNTVAFGENVVVNGKITVTALDLMSNHYTTVALVDNTTSKFAFISEANEELNQPGSSTYYTEMPDTYLGFIRVQMEIADNNNLAGIAFDEALMNGGQYKQSLTSTDPIAYVDPNLYENDLTDIALWGQEIDLQTGWVSISSYMDPFDPDVENMFDAISGQLIILQNFYGVYYPTYNMNTLGDWDPNSGYLVKVSQNCQLRVFGSVMDGGTLSLTDGWNLIPVKSTCDVNTENLFNSLGDDLVIVKDAAGTGIYWPEKGINTMPTLASGKAFYVKVTGNHIIEFPACP